MTRYKLKEIAGLITYPDYKLVFRDSRESLPLTPEEARYYCRLLRVTYEP